MLPELVNWNATRLGLHQAAQVIGAVRRALAEPESNWVHLGLTVTDDGLTTGVLPSGEWTLDFVALQLRYIVDGQTRTVPLARQTQQTLVDAVEGMMRDAGYDVTLDREKLPAADPLHIDAALAADYLTALRMAWDALSGLRQSTPGYRTRLVVWSHGFDAAFLWFPSVDATDEERDPHMGVGFSPGSPGLAHPYFYFYLWPLPDGLADGALPAPAHWHTEGWTGAILDYDKIRQADDPVRFVQDVLDVVFSGLSSRL